MVPGTFMPQGSFYIDGMDQGHTEEHEVYIGGGGRDVLHVDPTSSGWRAVSSCPLLPMLMKHTGL